MPPSPDVVVVGAGVIGCAVGYELARRGASVQIVDDRLPGMGATQASAGVLAPYIEAREQGPLLDLAVRSLDLFDEFVSAAARDGGCAIEYRRTGTIDVALGDAALEHLQASADLLAARGVAARMLEAAATRHEEPYLSKDILGGLFVPAHGFIAALGFTETVAAAARHHGARIASDQRVERIRPADTGNSVVVQTNQGAITAETVVVALGSWAGRVEIDGVDPPVPVHPVRGQLLHLSWRGTPLRRVTWSDRCYLVPWQDGTVLVGATVEQAGFDERTTAAGVRDLIEAACEVVPHAWTAGLLSARAGLRPATGDGLPIVGRSSVMPGLVYATGHYRNGILLSPLTAHLVANLILNGRNDPLLGPVSPLRFGRL